MYYKAIKDKNIVDVMDGLDCVKYSKVAGMALRCKEDENPGGIITSNGEKVYHVYGWPALPGYESVTLHEIQEEEYLLVKDLLEGDYAEGLADPDQPEEQQETETPVDKETLEWAKKTKVALSKSRLAKHLLDNPLQSKAHGGVMGTYSVTEEKQNLMLLNYSTYQIQKAAGVPTVLTWNQTGEECEVWTEEEFLQLIMEVQAYVKPLVSKQQSYEKRILSAKTLMEVDSIEIIY